ncbi:MAG: phosphoribosylaminoimidazolesuccinocarboxamide synthase [Candidatus Krumholzibacteria bacterium]|nr:phosphoribosylaminoimidazolesuccinocarboxamide synthase [Candidatus Krumholzibacteria bacterium]
MRDLERFNGGAAVPGVEPNYRGKVRDIYDLGDMLLIVATDRISAYDSVLPTPIPGKGIMLNMLSAHWFEWFDTVPNHMISVDVEDFPEPFNRHAGILTGRSMLVKKAGRIDLECIVRGYISGSGWREYKEHGSVCGISLPRGLKNSGRLEEPIFTPSTKAESGHDENISAAKAARLVGEETVRELESLSLELYTRASEYAAGRGIIIADTKFEFGVTEDQIILIDEALTPDSSRFWLADEYEPGRQQRSLDKQFVRDFLDEKGWDHSPPAPALPRDIVEKTAGRYRLAVEMLFPELDIERYL